MPVENTIDEDNHDVNVGSFIFNFESQDIVDIDDIIKGFTTNCPDDILKSFEDIKLWSPSDLTCDENWEILIKCIFNAFWNKLTKKITEESESCIKRLFFQVIDTNPDASAIVLSSYISFLITKFKNNPAYINSLNNNVLNIIYIEKFFIAYIYSFNIYFITNVTCFI